MPRGAVYVGRPTKWGNPCTVAEYGLQGAIAGFERHALPHLPVHELRGKGSGLLVSTRSAVPRGRPLEGGQRVNFYKRYITGEIILKIVGDFA